MLLKEVENMRKKDIQKLERVIIESVGKKALTEIQEVAFDSAYDEAESNGVEKKGDEFVKLAIHYRRFMINYAFKVINNYQRNGKSPKEIDFEKLMIEAKKIHREESVNEMYGLKYL